MDRLAEAAGELLECPVVAGVKALGVPGERKASGVADPDLGGGVACGAAAASADFAVGACEGVDAVVVAPWGKAVSSSRKALVWRPRTICMSPFSAAAATGRARMSLSPVARRGRTA